MICLKCRSEIEDLSMYCPNCGAPQFTPKIDEEIVLELSDPKKSKVIVTEVKNMTSALSVLKSITGLSIAELRTSLKELPAVIKEHLGKEEATETARQLREAGIESYTDEEAVSLEEKEDDPYGIHHIPSERKG